MYVNLTGTRWENSTYNQVEGSYKAEKVVKMPDKENVT